MASAKAMPGDTAAAARAPSKAVQVAKDLVAGTAGGVLQVLSAMPFDTIKVRMVCLPDVYTKGPMDCFRRTIANEGALGLYKGTLSPLVGVGACVAIQFGVLEYTKRRLVEARIANGQSERLSVGDMYIAGFVAGGANTVVSSPVEHIRIRMQVQTNAAGEAGMYKNTVDCARQVLRDYGVKGVYKGVSSSLVRETFGYGLYFSAYEMTKRKMMELQGITDPRALSTHPVDAIKSKMQGDSLSNPKYRTIMATARKIFAEEGVGGFFKGFGPCMLRAAPVNAATFIGFEACMKLLDAVG